MIDSLYYSSRNVPGRCEISFVNYRINYQKLCDLMRQITKVLNWPSVCIIHNSSDWYRYLLWLTWLRNVTIVIGKEKSTITIAQLVTMHLTQVFFFCNFLVKTFVNNLPTYTKLKQSSASVIIDLTTIYPGLINLCWFQTNLPLAALPLRRLASLAVSELQLSAATPLWLFTERQSLPSWIEFNCLRSAAVDKAARLSIY